MSKKTLLLILLSLIPALALAAAPTYDLLSPLGGMTTGVDLKTYLQKIIIVTIGIAGVLAVVMMVICGIKVIMSGSVSGKSEAKECIWNAIFGILIAISAWAFLYTINPDLLKNDVQLADLPVLPPLPPAAPRTDPNPTTPGCYFKYKRLDTGNISFTRADTCASCDKILIDFQTEPLYEVQSKCFEVKAGASPTAPTPPGQPPPAISGVKCDQSGRNLCEGKVRQCTNGHCAQFAGAAAKYAGGSVSAELIKAIIVQESSCGQNLTGIVTGSGVACGPTQFLPATANKFSVKCGGPQSVTCGWLSDRANWDKAVCMTAEYLRTIAASSCGSSVRNIAAGYNAGPGRCAPSVSCSGSQSCSGEAIKQWECLYDDTAHTQCNGGFIETRNYATSVLYCTQNPGY